MNTPEERLEVTIGLTLPAQAHESVKKRASTWHSLTKGLESPDEFRVQVLKIQSASKEDLPKIQRAFEEVKRDLEGEKFTVHTPRTQLVGRGVGLAAKSTESGNITHTLMNGMTSAPECSAVTMSVSFKQRRIL